MSCRIGPRVIYYIRDPRLDLRYFPVYDTLVHDTLRQFAFATTKGRQLPSTRCPAPSRHDEQYQLLFESDGAREEYFFHGHAEVSRS